MKNERLKNNRFSWTPFYMEFANKLLKFKNKRPELLMILEEVYNQLDLNNPYTD